MWSQRSQAPNAIEETDIPRQSDRATSIPYITRPRAPLALTFCASVLLSLIAIHFNPVLSRDSALYVDMARHFREGGVQQLLQLFDWPWWSILIGLASKTGMSATFAGYALMVLAMAACCTALVRTTRLIEPRAAYWGALVALTLPAFNAYRDLIIREPGFWLFSALAVMFMVEWTARRRWSFIAAALLSVVIAMVFRLEAALLIVAIALFLAWEHRGLAQGVAWSKASLSAMLFLGVALFVLAGWLLTSDQHRVVYYRELLDPLRLVTTHKANAALLAEAILAKYSEDDAATILFFGYALTIAWKSLLLCAPLLPLALAWRHARAQNGISRAPGLALLYIACGLYALVLLAFFIQHSFMIDRYISYLHVLGAPWIAVLVYRTASQARMLGFVVMALSILVGLSNVISLSPKRTHYFETAAWVEQHLPRDARIYYDDQRLSFYAGRGFTTAGHDIPDVLEQGLEEFDYLLIEAPVEEPRIQHLLARGEVEVLATFSNGHNRHVTVLRRP